MRDIVKRLPREVHTVGVFRNEQPAHVVEIVGAHRVCTACSCTAASRAPRSQWIRERVQFVIQAFAAGDPALATAANSPADVILVDSPDPGSGKVFDWRLAEGAPSGMRLLLAGGLTPQNVGDAIRLVRPWGVDVSSGVEATPGPQGPAQACAAFIEAAREAGARGRRPLDRPHTRRRRAASTRPWDWQLDE